MNVCGVEAYCSSLKDDKILQTWNNKLPVNKLAQREDATNENR